MTVEVTVSDAVAEVVISRPEALNAIDPQTRTELGEAWERASADDAVHAIVLTGAGPRAFCVGSDLKRTMPPDESYAQRTFGGNGGDHLLRGFPTEKPVVCAVNGLAIGGGLELALACDIRVCSTSAEFGLSEVRVGSIPGAGGTQRLPRLIGHSLAMQMLLTGDRIDAAEAHRAGLVSETCAPNDLLPRAHAIAERIVANAPLAVRSVKRLVNEGRDIPLDQGIRLENYVWGLLRDTEDRIEGRHAFQEKRAPRFQGR